MLIGGKTCLDGWFDKCPKCNTEKCQRTGVGAEGPGQLFSDAVAHHRSTGHYMFTVVGLQDLY